MSPPPIVVLDTTPVGLASQAAGRPVADRCKAWLNALVASGSRVVLPEIADYEIRRELIRVRATAGLRRLDILKARLQYEPITTLDMLRAAELWALVRRQGWPTAAPEALDGDCILAAQAVGLAQPGDLIVVATSNVAHLARFPGVDARPWEAIA